MDAWLQGSGAAQTRMEIDDEDWTVVLDTWNDNVVYRNEEGLHQKVHWKEGYSKS